MFFFQYESDHRYLASLDAFNSLKRNLTVARTSEVARRSVSTPFVARDMLAIIEALGESDLLTYWGFR